MKTRISNRIWCLAAAIVALGVMASSAAANTVRLKRGAMVDPAEALVLRDVADLEGAYASDLADTVIATAAEELLDATGNGSVSLDRVRAVLKHDGAIMGRLTFAGSSCLLRSGASPEGSRERPTRAGERERRAGEATSVATDEGWRTLEDWRAEAEATIEIAIVRRFMDELGVGPERLRLRFKPGSDELLGLASGARRTVIRPVSTYASSVVLLRVERYLPSGSVERSETVSVEVQILRSVLKVREQISRRQAIPGGVFEATEEWLAPTVDAVDASDAFKVIGNLAQTRLEPGTTLLHSHVEEPVAVERNSLVQVIYHVDGFVLKTQARARGEGRVGEIIEVRMEDTKSSFLARVDGPGRVIVVE